MSQEVSIVAIIQPAPGKLARIKEAFKDAIAWIEANEPETLQFAVYEAEGEDGVKLSIFERYASQAALEKHQSSDSYKAFFKAATEEQLLAGAPVMVKGKHLQAIKR